MQATLEDAPVVDNLPGLSLLRMGVGETAYAVPIGCVREILQVTRLTPLPKTPAFVKGVMNMRGAVVPVIDLGARLGHAASDQGRRACVVVVDGKPLSDAEHPPSDATVPIGLLVETVYEVFDGAPEDAEAVPVFGTDVVPEYLMGITRVRGESIGILSLDHVLSPAMLAEAIAQAQLQ